ncbi:MAG: hypothetical protein DRO99_02010 [Candidatus Aenigmatarchaeota archaeon]|nr:MAG: hypothetical protein DRO99_02010 [Candidatus Aenigmarchaeota archaeon]
MGVKDFIFPTDGKIAILALITLISFLGSSSAAAHTVNPYANPDPLIVLFMFFSLPLFFLKPLYGFPLTVVLFAYYYVLSCVYMLAYTHIEKRVRKEFPHINDRWIKRKKMRRKK